MVSTKSPFKLQDTPIKRHVKKNFFQEECVPMCELRKTSLVASLGQMGKQLHAGARKPEPGFYASSFGLFQSVRCPQLPLDKGYACRLWGRDAYFALFGFANMLNYEIYSGLWSPLSLKNFEPDKCTRQTVEFAGTLLRIRRARKQCATCWPLIGHTEIFFVPNQKQAFECVIALVCYE